MIETRVWRASPPRWRRSPPVGFIRPCEPTLTDHPPWTRLTARGQARRLSHPRRKQIDRVTLWSRRGTDFTDRFLNIAEAVRGLPTDDPLIDGEAVVFKDDGRSDFVALLTKRGWTEALFAAFDLLRLGGDHLRHRPLENRREALMRLVAKRRGEGIPFSEALAEEGAVVFDKACELGLEGIVSKRAGSFYKSRSSRKWLKAMSPDFVRT
jgi:bifunctional non-homologous end joining protein LigD